MGLACSSELVDLGGFERYGRRALEVPRLLAFFTLNTIALRRLIEPGCTEQMGEEVD